MAKLRWRKHISVTNVVKRLSVTVLSLWVGGVFFSAIANVINGTSSPFYSGLTLIGWTVGTATGTSAGCTATTCANTVTSVSGTGILVVIGIVGIASVVMAFVEVSF